MTPSQVVGDRIRLMREAYVDEAGNHVPLTQQGLAALCFVSQPTVSKWETGAKMPPPARRILVASALRMPAHALFREVLLEEEAELRRRWMEAA